MDQLFSPVFQPPGWSAARRLLPARASARHFQLDPRTTSRSPAHNTNCPALCPESRTPTTLTHDVMTRFCQHVHRLIRPQQCKSHRQTNIAQIQHRRMQRQSISAEWLSPRPSTEEIKTRKWVDVNRLNARKAVVCPELPTHAFNTTYICCLEAITC